jgi:phage N-6-adenine-methyltransferase
MKRPANPQAMAALNRETTYTGHPDLGRQVDVDTWLTPRWILSQLGEFNMDPCAALEDPRHVGAPSYYTKENDGLAQPWYGRVFMNPPYSDVAPWLVKAAQHMAGGVSLVPASVESRVWREWVWPRAVRILLLAGRVRFCNPDGSVTTGRPLRSVALIAWGGVDAVFLDTCTLAGVLLNKWGLR